MMNYLRFFLLSCAWLTAGAAHAQGKLSGVVQDSVTHEPLAFASVFLANTTLGATTTEQGQFEFARVPKGTYQVVGSYVGYRLSKQSVTVGADPQRITLQLTPTGNQLGEVVVQPPPNKPEDFQKFSKLFLGQSTFSEQCRISNPDQVRVFYDDSTRELTARAKEFVQIDNDALGYRVKYYGLYFAYDVDQQAITYYGEPVFQELTPRDEAQRQQWAANRAAAYTGSFMHFLRSVYTNRLKAAGFLAQRVGMVPNPRFERADGQRRALLARRPESGFTAAEQDSLAQWEREEPLRPTLYLPTRPIDSLRRVSADGQHAYLRFRDEVQVTHFGEAPDARYSRQPVTAPVSTLPANLAQRQTSRLKLTDGEAEIKADGTLVNPLEASIGGYWGFEKIGEFLPFDYVPPASAEVAPAAPAAPAPARKRR